MPFVHGQVMHGQVMHGQVMHGQALVKGIVVHVVETMPFFSNNHNNEKMPLLVFMAFNVLNYV